MAWFILLEMLSGLNLGYGLTYLNQCASLLYSKNGWTSVNERTWHISVLGSSMIVGQWLGSGIAGKLMRESRRKALFLSIIVGVIGCMLTLINVKVFWLLNFGRFLYGISSGIGSVVTPRFIEDFTPLYLYSIIGTSFVFSQMVGIFLALSDAYILPSQDDPVALATNSSWRIIFGLPLLFYVILFMILTFFIKVEGPKFCIFA